MSDKLDLGLKDFSQLVNGAAILLAFFVGYKYGLRNSSTIETKQVSSEGEADLHPLERVQQFRENGDCKMLLIVRNDLKMGKGKIAAQCGHAAVGAYQTAIKRFPRLVRLWDSNGCPKIAVKCESKAEIIELRNKAQAMNFNTCMIRDAGRTQVEPNTITVLAVGPANSQDLDTITRHLKLL
ncbi:putative peptidyl-tRNA hydrolase 2 [Pseudolycoriella hygida]|uniref:peptidyl-tRNA hydrolase n=1 Tax=Pseudolycoriella hygida TaxID=35572 RepID=A0A9Q0RZV7_9DIPT|nr:putative peptidyl-tRNA hydrolase 2 [Pseudolycoriella hygida]